MTTQMVGEKRPEAVIWTAGVLMTLFHFSMAALLVVLSTQISEGVNATVFVVYAQAVSSVVLVSLAYIIDKNKKPSFSFRFIAWAFFLGLLQIPLNHLMLAESLRYVTASFEGSMINAVPAVVFVLAVAARRERFSISQVSSQAKLWGTLISISGAILVGLSKDSTETTMPLSGGAGRIAGISMVVMGVLATAGFNILLEVVAIEYTADMTLTALMTVFGTLQALGYAAIRVGDNWSAWRITGNSGHELLGIVYSLRSASSHLPLSRSRRSPFYFLLSLRQGAVCSGIFYYANTWCVRKMGPIFTGAFSPLLVVFSLALETIFLGASLQPRSLAGSALVVAGMYLLLWAKSKEYAELGKRGDAATEAPLLEEGRPA